MNKLPIAAAALLFGTSAYAMIPSTEPTGVMAQKDPYVVTPAAEPVAATDEAWAFQPATETWWTDKIDSAEGYRTLAATDDMKMADVDAVADKMDAKFTADDEADADWMAARQAKLDTAGTDEPGLQPAAYETGFSAGETAPADVSDMTGIGGPYEAADASATLSPRMAAQNYPACRPGRGDDHCIQLYEPGVRAELASWNQPTGGFAGTSDTQVAMGGPYEPAEDSATATERLNQQALADSNRAVQMAAADAQPVDESAIETASADDGALMADDLPADEDVGEV